MAVTYFITKFVTAIEHVQCLMLRAYLVILYHRRDTFLIPGTVQLQDEEYRTQCSGNNMSCHVSEDDLCQCNQSYTEHKCHRDEDHQVVTANALQPYTDSNRERAANSWLAAPKIGQMVR